MTGPLRKKKPLLLILKKSVINLPTPKKMSFWWNFGSLVGLCLIMQILTGMFLAMHYMPDISLAFSSMKHLCRDVKLGWMLRKMHAKSASLFFICLYCHMGRGIYYGSYMKQETWKMGVMLFFMTMITAFVGYVLPWGQMSFWAATVMTKLVSAIPYMGEKLVQWLWGGFSVDNATLTRFYSFHFLFPFMMVALSILHLLFLHQTGSKNPLGMMKNPDKMTFHMYFSIKDLMGFLFLFAMLFMMVLLFPTALKDPENFMPANPLVTPTHMQPEWYFLFAYAMLRSIPNKLGGVMALMASMLMWFLVPMVHTSQKKGMSFSPINQIMFWTLIATFIILTWMGSQPVENPYIIMGQMFSMMYFSTFLVLFPSISLMEKKLTY